MSLPNRAFEKIFSKIFVYNLLFEDTEVDLRYLGLQETDRVLSIAGAGCGVAGLLSFNPRSIDVVDRNLAHLSLSAIKMLAPRYLGYDDFYRLLGYGRHEHIRSLLAPMMQFPHLPVRIKDYWYKNSSIFLKGLYESGLTTFMMQRLNKICRIDQDWLEDVAELPVAARVDRVQNDICLKLRHPLFKVAIASRLQMLSQGVNLRQNARIAQESRSSFHTYIMSFLQSIITTDVLKNWFIWVPVLKTFNHRDQQAVPPYLREEFYEKSARSQTSMHWHHRNIFDTLKQQRNEYWSYVNCSDALDWMDDGNQRLFLELVHQKGRPDATILLRTVENQDLVTRHGLEKRFRLVRDLSEQASREERSRLYQQVAFYRLVK